MQYLVDISKPPIGPPIRSIKLGFGIDVEMKESLARTEAWKTYIASYGKALTYLRKPKPMPER